MRGGELYSFVISIATLRQAGYIPMEKFYLVINTARFLFDHCLINEFAYLGSSDIAFG